MRSRKYQLSLLVCGHGGNGGGGTPRIKQLLKVRNTAFPTQFNSRIRNRIRVHSLLSAGRTKPLVRCRAD